MYDRYKEILFFTFYTTPLSSVIKTHNLDYHLYADNTQIYISLATPHTCRSLNQVRNFLQDVSLWIQKQPASVLTSFCPILTLRLW